MTEKPPGCRKLYCGNLSYNIDDDTMCEFFKECGEIVGLRWLTHKDSGDFRVCIILSHCTTRPYYVLSIYITINVLHSLFKFTAIILPFTLPTHVPIPF